MSVVALLPDLEAPYRVLAVGAHPDDIEIGAGGSLIRLLEERPRITVDITILTGDDRRRREAEASARQLTRGRLGTAGITVLNHRDAYLPGAFVAVKEDLARLREHGPYDLVLSPSLDDAHQDHRLTAELMWQLFRSSTILEYEIPKYEGIGEQPNLFIELTREACETKVAHLRDAFASQAEHAWFSDETFWATLRLRGIEAGAASGYAEGFISRKLRW